MKQTVTITDKIPQYTTFVSAENGGVEANGVITWNQEVEDGQSLTVSFKVKVNDDVKGEVIDNVSHVKDGVNESDTNETHNPTPQKPNTPKTSDSHHVKKYLGMMVISMLILMLCMLSVALYEKNKFEKNHKTISIYMEKKGSTASKKSLK